MDDLYFEKRRLFGCYFVGVVQSELLGGGAGEVARVGLEKMQAVL